MAYLIELWGPNIGRVIALSGDDFIGRQKGCKVHVRDTRVSRKHARVTCTDGKWSVEDLQSFNGTIINHVPVVGRASLQDGDILEIGGILLKFMDAIIEAPQDPSGSPPSARVFAWPPSPMN